MSGPPNQAEAVSLSQRPPRLKMSDNNNAVKDGIKSFLAGWAGGVGNLVVGHPFDTVKVGGRSLAGHGLQQEQEPACWRAIMIDQEQTSCDLRMPPQFNLLPVR